MPTIDMNDTTLYYERSGKGPAMLFVHGMCGDAEVWPTRPYASPTATPACATTGEATAAAAEATPPSATPCTPTTPPPSSRLSGWRRACWSDPAAAAIAVDVALRYGHLLRGAVFSEPPLFCLDPAAGQAIMEELTRRLAQAPRRADPAADVDGFFSLVCPRLWSMLQETRKDRYRANAHIGFTDLQSPSLDVAADDLAAVTIPALVFAGDTSHPSLRSVAHRLAEALPDARFVELADCGHVT